MITIHKKRTASVTHIEIIGAFVDQIKLSNEIGEVSGELLINCKGISRINSIGIKSWMHYFNELKTRGIKFNFELFPPALVEQINLISNFACGGKVTSVLLPYSCIACRKEFVSPYSIEILLSHQNQIPKLNCGKEKCEATFDDEPDYLDFLK